MPKSPRGRSAASLIDEALEHAQRATNELRDLVHGILPASLALGGLRSAVESMATDIPIPVRLRIDDTRLPVEVETTAYFIVAEALTNVVKHAQARHAEVSIACNDAADEVLIRDSDDGRGGADPAKGNGLTGLTDRADAARGILTVLSPLGGGTDLRVVLPLATLPAQSMRKDVPTQARS